MILQRWKDHKNNDETSLSMLR